MGGPLDPRRGGVGVVEDAPDGRSDGGGVVSAARRPVLGVSNVARFVLGIARKDPALRLQAVRTGDGLAFLMVRGDEVRGVVEFGVADGLVRDVWIQMNPAKLGVWTTGEGRA